MTPAVGVRVLRRVITWALWLGPFLLVAALLEIGWASGLKYTDGFTKPGPTVLVVIALTASMILLASRGADAADRHRLRRLERHRHRRHGAAGDVAVRGIRLARAAPVHRHDHRRRLRVEAGRRRRPLSWGFRF